jgi:D-xylose transport system substrate-binding protein
MTVYHPPKKLAEETAYLAAKLARKATQFDCQFVEVDNGTAKVRAVLLTPIAVDAKNLDSTIISDGVQKREKVYEK